MAARSARARRRLLLVGDFDNLGDALLAQVEAQRLRHDAPGEIVVCPYAEPPPGMAAPFDAEGARVLPIRARRRRFVAACQGAEIYIGGGHAIREAVSVGWLLTVLLGCWLARLGGGRCRVLGAGATDVRTGLKRTLWRLILASCAPICLRDAVSAAVVGGMFPPLAGRLRVANDIAFLGEFEAAPASPGPRAVCLVSPAVDHHEGRGIDADRLLALIGALHGSGVLGEVRLLAHDTRAAMDTTLCRVLAERVRRELGLRATLVDGPPGTRLLDAYRDADLVITGRLHGLIVAAMLHRPVICFGDTTAKLRPFAVPFGIPTAAAEVPAGGPEARRLAAYLRDFDHEAHRPVLARLRDEAGLNLA